MTADNDLIEQIVANVLAELQPAAAKVRAPVEQSLASSQPSSHAIELDAAVITADVLEERVRKGQSLRIGNRAILTPSARDWLAQRKIAWTRSSGASTAQAHSAARWQLIITTATPAVGNLRQELAGWKTDLLGTPQEAAEQATRAICTGESDGVLALCRAADVVACLANRNPKVRAAVLRSTADLSDLASQLDPNLLVVNPQQKSFVELRNIVRAIGALAKPRGSNPWASGN